MYYISWLLNTISFILTFVLFIYIIFVWNFKSINNLLILPIAMYYAFIIFIWWWIISVIFDWLMFLTKEKKILFYLFYYLHNLSFFWMFFLIKYYLLINISILDNIIYYLFSIWVFYFITNILIQSENFLEFRAWIYTKLLLQILFIIDLFLIYLENSIIWILDIILLLFISFIFSKIVFPLFWDNREKIDI